MKKLLLILSLIICSQIGAFCIENTPQEVKVYSEKNKFGLQTSLGEQITPATYHKLIRLDGKGWLAQKGPKYGILGSDGNWLVEPKYRHADRFFGRLVKLGNDHDYGIYDATGKIIIPPEYSDIEPLFGRMFLTKKHYLYGVSSFDGEVLLDNVFQDLYMPSRDIMRIKQDGDWFEVTSISDNDIELPSNAQKVTLNNKDFKITYLVSTTGIASGYSVVTTTDYTIKLFSSISPAYEQTIDELMLSKGADTVSILMNLSWIPKFPITYAKKYYQNVRNPYNGPLNDLKSDLKKKL